MSWSGGSSQPQQARLAQALHDFGDATDQAVRAWAGELTVRQALDITYVLTDILRLLGTTAGRLSRYQAGSQPAPDHDAGPDQPDEEIAQARASISSARAALVHPFQEAYRASGGWPEPGGDPARDGPAVFLAHLLYRRLHMPLVATSFLAAELAVGSNYLLHDGWTFAGRSPSLRQFAKFNAASLGGLAVNVLSVWLLVHLGLGIVLANLAGIAAGFAVNLVLSATWVWGQEK